MSYVGLGVAVEASVYDGLTTTKPPPVPKCMKPADVEYMRKCMTDSMAGKSPVKNSACYWVQNSEAFEAALEKVAPCPKAVPQIGPTPLPTAMPQQALDAAKSAMQRAALIGLASTVGIGVVLYLVLRKKK